MENSKAKVVMTDPDTGLTYTIDFSYAENQLDYNVISELGSADQDKAYIVNVLFGDFMDAVNAHGEPVPQKDTLVN